MMQQLRIIMRDEPDAVHLLEASLSCAFGQKIAPALRIGPGCLRLSEPNGQDGLASWPDHAVVEASARRDHKLMAPTIWPRMWPLASWSPAPAQHSFHPLRPFLSEMKVVAPIPSLVVFQKLFSTHDLRR